MFLRPRILCAVLLLSTAAQLFAQQEKPFDTSYIASDSFFTIVARPSQLLKYVDEAKAKQFSRLFLEEAGMDIRLMDEFIVDFGGDVDVEKGFPKPNDVVGVIGRFHGGLNQTRLLEEFPGNREGVEHDGKTYYPATSDHQPSLYFPDKESFVIAGKDRLKKLMSQQHSMNTMVSRLRKAGRDYDVLILAELDSGRALVNEVAKNIGAIVPGGEFDPQVIAEKIESAELRVKLSKDVPLRLAVTVTDEKAAEDLRSKINGLLTIGKVMWTGLRKDALNSDPNEEMAKMAVGVVDDLLAGTKVSAKGNEIHVHVEKKGGFPELVEVVGLGIFGVRAVKAEAVPVEVRDIEPPAPAPERPAPAPKPKRK